MWGHFAQLYPRAGDDPRGISVAGVRPVLAAAANLKPTPGGNFSPAGGLGLLLLTPKGGQ